MPSIPAPRLDGRDRAVPCIRRSGVVEGQMIILYPCGWPCPRCDRASKPWSWPSLWESSGCCIDPNRPDKGHRDRRRDETLAVWPSLVLDSRSSYPQEIAQIGPQQAADPRPSYHRPVGLL